MAYETASANDPDDLLDKLQIFAAANGWTIDYAGVRLAAGGASDGSGLDMVALHKDGAYFVLYHDNSSSSASNPTPRIRAYTYPGPWVATNGVTGQTGRTEACAANNIPGTYAAYHLFTDDAQTYLHAVIEVTAGRFSHFGIGLMDKAGVGDSVPYAYGLTWNWASSINTSGSNTHGVPFDAFGSSAAYAGTVLRANSDAVSPRNYEVRSSGGSSAFAVGGWRSNTDAGKPCLQRLLNIGPSALTGRAPLLPLIVLVERSTDVWSFAGTAPDMRLVRMDNLAPGDLMTIGADDWKVFPIVRKNGPSGVENSDAWGYAFKVVP